MVYKEYKKLCGEHQKMTIAHINDITITTKDKKVIEEALSEVNPLVEIENNIVLIHKNAISRVENKIRYINFMNHRNEK